MSPGEWLELRSSEAQSPAVGKALMLTEPRSDQATAPAWKDQHRRRARYAMRRASKLWCRSMARPDSVHLIVAVLSGWSRCIEVEVDAEHTDEETDRRGAEGGGNAVAPEADADDGDGGSGQGGNGVELAA